MAKYYVRCGKVKKIIDRGTREHAAFDAVEGEARSGDGRFHDLPNLKHLGLVTTVSEQGFSDRRATHYPTHKILCRIDVFSRFDASSETNQG